MPRSRSLINTPLKLLVSTQVTSGRSAPVPEGHLKIAQRFSAGWRLGGVA